MTFSCGKCSHEPEEWETVTEEGLATHKCPRCGKKHHHIKTETTEDLLPVDAEDEEVQNIFITPTGRKIRGVEKVENFISQVSNPKFCKNCKERKSDAWKYSISIHWDIRCSNCGQRHLEDITRLIPVDEEGNRLNVLEDQQGNTYLGQDVQAALEKLKESKSAEGENR